MSKQTDKRAAEAAAILGQPVRAAASFSSGLIVYLQFLGGLSALAVGILYRRVLRRRAGTSKVVLPGFFVLALTDDALVVLGQGISNKAKGPALHAFPHGQWRFTTPGRGVLTKGSALTLGTGESLSVRAQTLGVSRGNAEVMRQLAAASEGTDLSAPAPSDAAAPAGAVPVVPAAQPRATVAAQPAAMSAPETVDEDRLAELVEELGLEDRAEQVHDLALPSARLVAVEATPEELKTRGGSRFGGWPDVSGLADWPLAEDGEPLGFVLQLDLAELAELDVPSDLPLDGVLSVFQDVRGGPPVLLHTPAGAALKRLRAPGVKAGVIAPSLPSSGSHPLSGLEPVLTLTLPGTLAEDIDLDDEDVIDLLDAVNGTGPLHRVGGWPRELTGPVTAQAAAEAKGRRKVDDFTFVLQLDHDPANGLVVEGGGLAYLLTDARTAGSPEQLVAVVQSE